jgi:hypothetical protein
MIETLTEVPMKFETSATRNGSAPHHLTIDIVFKTGRAAIPAASGGAVIGGAIGSMLAPAIGAPIGALVGASLGSFLSIYSRNEPRL